MTRLLRLPTAASSLRTIALRATFALLATLVLFAAHAARPSGTFALSCMAPPPLDQAIKESDIVFVGTVTALANDGHLASVAVEEVWVGPDMPAVVEVGNVRPANDPESVWDRIYALDTKYVFFPYVEEGRLVDSPCGFTQEWQPDVERFRPADYRTPTPSDPGPTDPVSALGGLLGPALGVGLLAVVVVGGAMFVSRRRA